MIPQRYGTASFRSLPRALNLGKSVAINSLLYFVSTFLIFQKVSLCMVVLNEILPVSSLDQTRWRDYLLAAISLKMLASCRAYTQETPSLQRTMLIIMCHWSAREIRELFKLEELHCTPVGTTGDSNFPTFSTVFAKTTLCLEHSNYLRPANST